MKSIDELKSVVILAKTCNKTNINARNSLANLASKVHFGPLEMLELTAKSTMPLLAEMVENGPTQQHREDAARALAALVILFNA